MDHVFTSAAPDGAAGPYLDDRNAHQGQQATDYFMPAERFAEQDDAGRDANHGIEQGVGNHPIDRITRDQAVP